MCELAGIFVGGRARRMGGLAKGLLRDEDGKTLVERWRDLFGEHGVSSVLVGAAVPYAHLALPTVPDDPPGVGPLGGLAGLLASAGRGQVVAVACDMPHVSRELLTRLMSHPSERAIVAPRREHGWEPFFARYDAARVLPEVRRRILARAFSLQGLLDDVATEELSLTSTEQRELTDWDAPEDVDVRS